jgi:phosphonate transport system substrate-binding protein
MSTVSRWFVSGIVAAVVMCGLATAATTHECKNRGQLDEPYCDEDNDLVADVPQNPMRITSP